MSATATSAPAGQPVRFLSIIYEKANPKQVPLHVIIDPAGDATLRVYHPQRGTTFIGDDGVTSKKGQILVTFKITKKVLIDNSKHFQTQFSTTWSRDGQTTFDLGEEHAVAFGIWLRVLHNAMNDSNREVAVEKVWHAVQLSKKYLLPVEKLNGWFDE